MKKVFTIMAMLLPCIVSFAAEQNYQTFYSPSKKISIQIGLKENSLQYAVQYKSEYIITPSALCWTANNDTLGNHVTTLSFLNKGNTVSRYPTRGAHNEAYNRYRTVIAKATSQSGQDFLVEFRIYDSGIAFRYLLSQEKMTDINDLTTFCLPPKCQTWLQDNIVSYEGLYKSYRTGELPPSVVAGPPVTIEYPSGIYAVITEGGLSNFAGMELSVVSPGGFQARLDVCTRLAGSIATPWRIIMVGSLNELVNNDIISDVSDALSPVFKGNTDWIQTGNCLWSWLTGYDVTPAEMKKFVDWAAELHAPYVLVDEGWSHWKETARNLDAWQLLAELTSYASGKGVKIVVWKSYPKRKGIESIASPEKRREFFLRCKEAGVSGVKLDFFNSESQDITRYYEETLKEAAEMGLVVIFHGSNKPTGLEYTYPNEISREGIRGMESGADAAQNVITPFTRFLSGHADYTPLFLGNTGRNGRNWKGNTTEAHQIASTAIFFSPFRCYSGRPEEYILHPAKDIFLDIPVAWDETIVLPPSEIGSCVLMARRKGETWYVAALSSQAQSITVDLSFLSHKKYEATLIQDAEGTTCTITNAVFSRRDNVDIKTHNGGGFLIKLTPIRR